MSKICSKCKVESDNFARDSSTKDRLHRWCKTCNNKNRLLNKRTIRGALLTSYNTQLLSTRRKGFERVKYSKEEFISHFKDNKKYLKLFNEWVDSGYLKMKKPSFDRIDDYRGYSFENIQIMTWEENDKKARIDKMNGINNKQNKAVIQYDLDNNFIEEYHSMHEANRVTGISYKLISACCNKNSMTSKGYIWRFKDAS